MYMWIDELLSVVQQEPTNIAVNKTTTQTRHYAYHKSHLGKSWKIFTYFHSVLEVSKCWRFDSSCVCLHAGTRTMS